MLLTLLIDRPVYGWVLMVTTNPQCQICSTRPGVEPVSLCKPPIWEEHFEKPLVCEVMSSTALGRLRCQDVLAFEVSPTSPVQQQRLPDLEFHKAWDDGKGSEMGVEGPAHTTRIHKGPFWSPTQHYIFHFYIVFCTFNFLVYFI